jgi:hypothetical protein
MATVANGGVFHLHTDPHGSVIAVSLADALQQGPFTYDPYGDGTGSGTVPYRYAGMYQDAETRLYYDRARYYAPVTVVTANVPHNYRSRTSKGTYLPGPRTPQNPDFMRY